MIEQWLAWFLMDPTTGSTGNAVRQAAREAVRNAVGKRVFLGRRKADKEGDYQITMQRMSSQRYNDLDGEDSMVMPIISVDVWGRGDRARHDVPAIAEDVRKALSGYRGVMTNSDGERVFVNGVAVLRDAMPIPQAPEDVQLATGWRFHWSFDIEVNHVQQEV